MATQFKFADPDSEQSRAQVRAATVEGEIANSIKSLQEEYQQVSELLEMERTYSNEVTDQIKQIISSLNESYRIKPESISNSDSSITDVVLTPQGVVCVFRNNGTVVSRPLEAISSEVLMRVLAEVVPNICLVVMKRRQKLTGRVMTLEKLSKDMRRVPSIVSTSRKESPADRTAYTPTDSRANS